MGWRNRFRMLGTFIVAGLVACGGSRQHEPADAGVMTMGSVSVTNNTSLAINEFYMCRSSETKWGPNQFASPVPPGQSRMLTGVPPGSYDARALLADGYAMTLSGFAVNAGSTTSLTVNPPTPTTGALTLVNLSSTSITEVFLSPHDSSSWGAKQNPSPIAGSLTLDEVPPGSYDILAIYPDTYGRGRGKVMSSLVVAAGETLTVMLDVPTRVTVVLQNALYVAISEFYARPSGGTWTKIKMSALPAQTARTFYELATPGNFDFRAIASDGRAFEASAVLLSASYVKVITVGVSAAYAPEASLPAGEPPADETEPFDASGGGDDREASPARSSEPSVQWLASPPGLGEEK